MREYIVEYTHETMHHRKIRAYITAGSIPSVVRKVPDIKNISGINYVLTKVELIEV